MNLKARLIAIVIILIFAVLMYVNWHQLSTSGTYSVKLAAFTPVGLIGGFFLLLFPTRAGKPTTTADKLLVLGVFVIGLIAGLVNWYLMDPGFFGR
jgi:carbon starvation protein CstA